MIYITLYITECLKKLQKCRDKNEGMREMHTLAIQNFDIPGGPTFPLNAMYAKPRDRAEEDAMRLFIQQIRQETGLRLCARVFDTPNGLPSKWWTCFVKRKFMDKSL